MRRMMKVRLLLFFALLFAVGCNSTPVAFDLTQKQASEIVAVLSSQGIYAEASKGVGGKALFTVSVKAGYYTQAVTLLHERGLPREPELSFSELIESKGFLPNSREMEKVRLDRALAVEIEKVLSNLPPVKSARVIARVNYQTSDAPAVSIAIEKREGGEIDTTQLQELVAKTIPGLQPEGVGITVQTELPLASASIDSGSLSSGGKVITVPLTPFLFSFRVPEGDYNGLAFALLVCLIVVAVVGGVIGYWYGFYQQSKSFFESEFADLTGPKLPAGLEENKSLPARSSGGSEGQ